MIKNLGEINLWFMSSHELNYFCTDDDLHVLIQISLNISF